MFSVNLCAVVIILEFLDNQVQKHAEQPQMTSQCASIFSFLSGSAVCLWLQNFLQNKLFSIGFYRLIPSGQKEQGEPHRVPTLVLIPQNVSFLHEHMLLDRVSSARLSCFDPNWTIISSLERCRCLLMSSG